MSLSPSSLERAAARNLVVNYLRIKPGENVIVEAWTHTLSMSSAMVDGVRRVGGSAFLAYEDDNAWWRAVERKQARPLGRLSDPEWAAIAAADVYVQFWGPADSARLEKRGQKGLDAWADGWFDRWMQARPVDRVARRTDGNGVGNGLSSPSMGGQQAAVDEGPPRGVPCRPGGDCQER